MPRWIVLEDWQVEEKLGLALSARVGGFGQADGVTQLVTSVLALTHIMSDVASPYGTVQASMVLNFTSPVRCFVKLWSRMTHAPNERLLGLTAQKSDLTPWQSERARTRALAELRTAGRALQELERIVKILVLIEPYCTCGLIVLLVAPQH